MQPCSDTLKHKLSRRIIDSAMDDDYLLKFAMFEQAKRIADALEKQVEIAQKTLDRINEIK